MLAAALAAMEHTQASKEYDNCDGLLNLVFSVCRTALVQVRQRSFVRGPRGALVPAKQWTCSAQRKELEDPQARLGASIKRGPDLYDARTVFEAELEDATRATADACAVLESKLQ